MSPRAGELLLDVIQPMLIAVVAHVVTNVDAAQCAMCTRTASLLAGTAGVS
jgi:hypothetical protein